MSEKVKPFTDAELRGLPVPATGRVSKMITGEPILEARLYSDGRKVLALRRSVNGKDVRVTLGAFGKGHHELSLSAARRKAREIIVKFDKEGDFRETERSALKAKQTSQAYTVDRLIEDWEKHATKRLRPSTLALHRQQIKKHIRPAFGKKALDAVRREDVRALMNEIGENHPVQANKVTRLIAQLFQFARRELERDVANPAADLAPFPETARQRALNADEIKTFIEGLDNPALPPGPQVALALKIGLYSAQRIGEIVGMRDGELDFSANVWTVPGERTKSGRPNRVPLTPKLALLIRSAQALRGSATGNAPVFPMQVAKRRKRKNKDALPPLQASATLTRGSCTHGMSRLMKKLKLTAAGPHDLRRTARTLMSLERLAIPFADAEHVMSHSVGSAVSRIYIVNDFLPEKRRALLKLEAELERIIERRPVEGTDNVVSLEAARA